MNIAAPPSSNLIDLTKKRLEAVLEQSHKDKTLEKAQGKTPKEEYTNIILTSGTELLELILEFENTSQNLSTIEVLQKFLEIIQNAENIKQRIIELGFLKKSQVFADIVVVITTYIAIIFPFLINEEILHNSELNWYKECLERLELVREFIDREIVKSTEPTSLKRYITSILYLNNKIIERTHLLKHQSNKGFENSTRIEKESQDIQKLIHRIIDLLNFALITNQKMNEDSILRLTGISWSSYESLLQSMEDESWCRISYANETLELVVPKKPHEKKSRLINSLVELYFDEFEIPYCAVGSADVQRESVNVGKQPDESYIIGRYCRSVLEEDIPDLAIEVNRSSGSIKDLKEKYQPLGVPEVWMWEEKQGLKFYTLETDGYSPITNSQKLHGITSEIMNKYLDLISIENSKTVRKEFMREIQGQTNE